MDTFGGESNPSGAAGDFSFLQQCTLSFMPLDGLADAAEYTSKKILQLI
jgi:hypothetical protein